MSALQLIITENTYIIVETSLDRHLSLALVTGVVSQLRRVYRNIALVGFPGP
jgi:hypothetical protein